MYTLLLLGYVLSFFGSREVYVCTCVRVACSFPAWMCFRAPGGQAAQEHMASHCSTRGSAFHPHKNTIHPSTSSLCDPLKPPPFFPQVLQHTQKYPHTQPLVLCRAPAFPHPALNCWQLTYTGMTTHTINADCPEVIDDWQSVGVVCFSFCRINCFYMAPDAFICFFTTKTEKRFNWIIFNFFPKTTNFVTDRERGSNENYCNQAKKTKIHTMMNS